MAYNKTVTGLQLYSGYPGSLYPVPHEYSFTRNAVGTTDRRVKPVGLSALTNQTSYSKYVSMRTRAMQVDLSSGYQQPSAYGAAPEGFDNQTYQDGRRAVVTKLLEKIKGEQWNLSTFLGELPETLAWFRNTLDDMVGLYRGFAKMKPRELAAVRRRRLRREAARKGSRKYLGDKRYENTSNIVSGRWLEWRYAVTPMMLDFDAMLKALYDSQTRLLVERRVAGSKLKFHESQIVADGPSPVIRDRTHEMELRLGAYIRINPDIQAFKRLGLLNPVATLWELVPLSFIVDWLIPIGDYLGSLDAMAGVQVLSTWESHRIRTKMIYSGGVLGYGNYLTVVEPSEGTVDRYDRIPGVSIALSPPTFQLSLSTKRFLDALALTRQILLSGK